MLMLAVTHVAQAGSLTLWTTPDGGVYVGADPPSGSVPKLTSRSSAAIETEPETIEAATPDAHEPAAEGYLERLSRERAEERERRRAARERKALPARLIASRTVAVTGTTTTADGVNQIVEGRVANGWDEPIHDVQACAPWGCYDVRPSTLQPGATGEFAFATRDPRVTFSVRPKFRIDREVP